MLRFQRLADDVTAGTLDEGWLRRLEEEDNAFPDLDWTLFRA